MPKEYDDIKKEYRSKHKDWSDKKLSETAAKVFYSIFGITVKEAMELEKKGKWKSWLKSHSKKKSDKEEVKTLFNITSFEIKEDDGDYYVSGFVSAPIKDEKGEYLDQAKLVEKLNDPNNHLSKNLSYGHGWIKGDKNDMGILGVLQKAELKEHPKYHKPAAFGIWKLIKTHPYFNRTLYEIREHALKGLSVEINKTKKKLVKLGNTIVNKVTDYFLGGVAIVGRPLNLGATLYGYERKEFYYNGGENMEVKEDEKVEEINQTESEVSKNNEVKETEKATENKQENIKKESPNKDSGEELNKLKKEVEELKIKKAEEERAKEIERLRKELESLKAEKRVIIDNKPQNFENQDPIEAKKLEEAKEIEEIKNNKNLSIKEKLYKLALIDFKNKI